MGKGTSTPSNLLERDRDVSQDPTAPVVVYVAANRNEAEVVRAKLESYGIQAALQYQSVGRVLGLYIDGWGETRVIVPAEQAEEAREILSSGDIAAETPEDEVQP